MSPALRVAIVGAGPAGLYAAGQLLEQIDVPVEVDLLERLPTPHGLVRAGVAPDHPLKKRVIDNLFGFYLDHPCVRFFGNVELGSTVLPADLAQWYHAVIYAVGANDDRRLGIPGEQLDGSYAAREFVAWYNGHPDFSERQFDLSSERAVIVGNGNVALDVARILACDPQSLRKTEMADYAIDALSRSAVKEVVILGRRSHMQGAFNNPELEQLAEMSSVKVELQNATLAPEQLRLEHELDWLARRKVSTLRELASREVQNPRKRIVFQFLTSPESILGNERVQSVSVRKNCLLGDTAEELRVEPTPEVAEIETGLLFRAIGYRGRPLPQLPFEESTGTIPNVLGRVQSNGEALAGVYVTGWVKRGPLGVIGSNKKCARETTQSLFEDAAAGRLDAAVLSRQAVAEALQQRSSNLVELSDWRRIDSAERLMGAQQSRPRVKFTNRSLLLQAAERSGPTMGKQGENTLG